MSHTKQTKRHIEVKIVDPGEAAMSASNAVVLNAVNAIMRAIEPLPREAQIRVLKSAAAFFDIEY